MIYELVSDERFIEHVGHVYTEMGSVSIAPSVEQFLNSGELTESEIDSHLQHIFENFNWMAVWPVPNFYEFLYHRQLQQSLAVFRMAVLHLSRSITNAQDAGVLSQRSGANEASIGHFLVPDARWLLRGL